MGTLAVGAALAGVLGWAVRSMVRDKRKGRSLQCGMNCKCCKYAQCGDSQGDSSCKHCS